MKIPIIVDKNCINLCKHGSIFSLSYFPLGALDNHIFVQGRRRLGPQRPTERRLLVTSLFVVWEVCILMQLATVG